MALWELKFRHYAPKGSEEGIICYLVAESSEQIYEFLKTDPRIPDGTDDEKGIYVDWMDKDDPDNELYDENHKNRLIGCCGEMYDDEAELNDLFYGLTHYGWRIIDEHFKKIEINTLKSYGIIVIDAIKEIAD